MRLPVPRNRLVALTILGMVLTAGLGVALASPSLVLGENPDPTTDASPALGPDAPSPNHDFRPAAQSTGYEGDHEVYEDHDDDEEHEADDGEDGWFEADHDEDDDDGSQLDDD
jgi:hypothetical protein